VFFIVSGTQTPYGLLKPLMAALNKTVWFGLAFTPEIDCDQTAIGLPPASSAVFLIAQQFR
jgi:hypothetical protein